MKGEDGGPPSAAAADGGREGEREGEGEGERGGERGGEREGGGTLLLLRVPSQLLVGLDMAQWRVGKKFRGIRSVEPGCHFLHWTESGESEASASESAECTYTRMRVDEAIGSTGQRGEFLYFKGSQVIIREWSSSLSRFLPLSEEETLRYAAGVERQDFIHGLGVYPQHMRTQWRALTANISAACVSRVEPIGHCLEAQGMPLSKTELDIISQQTAGNKQQKAGRCSKRISLKRGDCEEADEEGEDEEEEEGHKQDEEEDENKRELKDSAEAASCKMFYMDVRPARSSAVRAGREAAAAARRLGGDAAAAAAAAAAAVTSQCVDRTDTLLQLARENEEGWKGILGELEMAFIALVLGHHYPSFVHWRQLVELLVASERAVYLHPEWFSRFILSFHAQLEQAPDEMTEGALQEGSFLSGSCAALLENCCCIDREAALLELRKAATLEWTEKHKARKRGGPGGEEEAASPAEEEAEEAAIGQTAKMRLRALEPSYREVEKAAGRLCDLARLLFKVARGGGELGEISEFDEVLLALQGPDAPVVVELTESQRAALLPSSEDSKQPDAGMQED